MPVTAPQDDDPSSSDAFEQLVEYQRQVYEIARTTVAGVKRMITMREALEPGFSEPFANMHGAWYDAVERDLVACGFQSLGAWQDARSAETPAEKRSFYRFAVNDDRTIVASWFVIPAEEPFGCVVLESWLEDGSHRVTGSGIFSSGVPEPPGPPARILPGNTPLEDVVSAHREEIAHGQTAARPVGDMDEVLALRSAEAERIAAFRSELGLGLFEPLLRHTYGDEFDELGTPVLESIRQHPEWWTGEEAPPAEAPVDGDGEIAEMPLRLMFLTSRDEESGRVHITSLGMAFHGLPELQMKQLAANHCRAGRFLMMGAGRRLAAHAANMFPEAEDPEERLSGLEIDITPNDVHVPPEHGLAVAGGTGPVRIRVELEAFGAENGASAEDDTARLLRILPPAGSSPNADAWLVESCRRLGLDAPPPLPASAFEQAMRAASRVAVRDLDEFRQRFTSGQLDGDVVMIKTGLPTSSGGTEFVWVRVSEAPAGAFVGTLESEPDDCPGYTQGQAMRVTDADVFDRGVFSESMGIVEQPLTDLVAQDFGVDLPN